MKTVKKERQEDKEDNPQYAFTNIEYKYYCCGETGHKSPPLPHKDNIVKTDWAISQENLSIKQK